LKLAIVGLGLIGTSVALATRRAWPDATLVGVDRADVIRHPRIVDLFTVATTELTVVAEADLIVLSTPVDVILETIPRLRDIAPHARVMDTGSTKRSIVAAARAAQLANFLGGHPMAGSENTGPDAGRADLFDARPWFLIGESAAANTGRFVQQLGATPVYMNDDGSAHDRLVAAVSHLPQVVVSALMARVGEAVGPDGLAYAGGGLRDTTRLAASEARVWESILATNADALQPLLLDLARELERIAVRLHDSTAVRRLFGMANLHRRELTGRTSR
jgi:prephenate dehydrogenase